MKRKRTPFPHSQNVLTVLWKKKKINASKKIENLKLANKDECPSAMWSILSTVTGQCLALELDHFYGAAVYSLPCLKCFAFYSFCYIVCLFWRAASLFLTCKTHRPILLLEKEGEEKRRSSTKTEQVLFNHICFKQKVRLLNASLGK